MNEIYATIPSVDLALGRAALRRAQEKSRANEVGVMVMTCTIDRLLDRRLVLMGGGS